MNNGHISGLPMKVSLYKEMGCAGILMRMIYKLLRLIQVTVWFYFLPFLALLGSYFVPYLYKINGLDAVT